MFSWSLWTPYLRVFGENRINRPACNVTSARHLHKGPCCTLLHSSCQCAEVSERCVWSLGHLFQNFLPSPNTTEHPYASLGVCWKACLSKLLFYWSWCMTVIALSALCILITWFPPPLPLPPLSLGVMGSPRVQLRIIPIKEQASCDAGEVALFIKPALKWEALLKERLWNQSSHVAGVGGVYKKSPFSKGREVKVWDAHVCL